MAYKIIGNVHKIGTTETKISKNGTSFQRRSLTLIQRRFDHETGEEREPYYPTLDFSGRHCPDLDGFKPGDRVQVTFEIVGTKYNDRNTGEEKYMNALRAFRIEPYIMPGQQPTAAPQQPMQAAPMGNTGYAPNPQPPQPSENNLPF